MNEVNSDQHARRLITEKCLIAADVDRTILTQIDNREQERLVFFQEIAPKLVEAARLGAHVGLITGNSMHELSSRVLNCLILELVRLNEMHVLDRFHFFCNSGGVYFHFSSPEVEKLSGRARRASGELSHERFWKLIVGEDSEKGECFVRPQFVDAGYIERCIIDPRDVKVLEEILNSVGNEYFSDLMKNTQKYRDQYDLSLISENGNHRPPKLDPRATRYLSGSAEKQSTVQITLKPVLSFRHGRNDEAKRALIDNDIRSRLVREIQKRMDQAGFNYVPRPGGRASIDVTLERLDKAYALEFLIDRLRLQGHAHRGDQFGSNAVYLGDEVIVGGGNDYPVTRIPGLLVLAVNPDKHLVPFKSGVFVPSCNLEGPAATAQVLSRFNECAKELLAKFKMDGAPAKTAIQELKEEIFIPRICDKIDNLKHDHSVLIDDWQTLHTFVTLMGRDKASREWLSLLVKELDAIMTKISTATPIASLGPSAVGTSRPRE